MSHKRRKTSSEGEYIKVGGKNIISLKDWLRPSSPETEKHEKPKNASKNETPRHEPEGKKPTKDDAPPEDRGNEVPERGDKSLLRVREKLPIWKYRGEIRDALRSNDVLLVVAETGSGKSTQVPQFLSTESWCRKKMVSVRIGNRQADAAVGGVIAITQPRRVAATTLAHRVSKEAGTPLGQSHGKSQGLVGYSVRFDHYVPLGAKIKFLTEGMLLQELLRDPNLRQYSAVILDEIHERSVDVDLLAGFLKQIISGDKSGRGGIPLKIVAMSATASVEKTLSFFSFESGAGTRIPACIKIPGRLYPVDIIHTPKPVPDLRDALVRTIFKVHVEQPCPGDILAFLTGQEEIEATQKIIEEYAETLETSLPKVRVLPLFGQMSIEAQQKAFQPVKGTRIRKIVLATNIAETSVTVPGVRYVVDCGKAKVKRFRVRLGMESLLAKPISKSSAIQRAGRAGREAAGRCYRLYTEETFKTLQEADLPEILRIDVLGAVLTMKARGIQDIFSFPLMDCPNAESFEKAMLHLHILGALADDGSITEMGRKMALFPVTAPYGRVLLAAADPEYDCLLEAIDIIACITAGDDIFYQLRSEEEIEDVEMHRKELYRREGDLVTYLTTMQQYTAENADRREWCNKRKINARLMQQALSIRKQLRGLCLKEKMLDEPPPSDPQPFSPMPPDRAETLVKCFLRGFSVKTAILAPDSSYVTSTGKHVVAIHPSSVLHGQKKEAIMFLEHVFTQKKSSDAIYLMSLYTIAGEA